MERETKSGGTGGAVAALGIYTRIVGETPGREKSKKRGLLSREVNGRSDRVEESCQCKTRLPRRWSWKSGRAQERGENERRLVVGGRSRLGEGGRRGASETLT